MVALREGVTRLLEAAAGRRLPYVFIEGETGTGKTELARALHTASGRKGPFVHVNCAAITETIAEGELYGRERGAYTDAREARPGLFQQANNGTLFLDELVLMSGSVQSKMLTAIEGKTVRRVGGTREESVDIWVIAASNEKIDVALRERRLRDDLYHRLAKLPLRVPPLRERGKDLLPLAEHLVDYWCREYGLPSKSLDEDARGALLAYDWPGNVRDLANVIERTVFFVRSAVITADSIAWPPSRLASPADQQTMSKPERDDSAERERLLAAWRAANGNLSRAADMLGIPRNTLRYRLIQLNVLPAKPKGASATESHHPAPADPEPVVVLPASQVRPLALLRVALGSRSADSVPADSALLTEDWITTATEKIEDFGGSVIEESPTHVVAAFGFQPVDDAPGRAAYTATALHRAVERALADGQDIRLKLAIDVRRYAVHLDRPSPELDGAARRDISARLESLEEYADVDVVVASEAAATRLARHFDVVRLERPASARQRVYRILGIARPGLGFGRRIARFVGRDHDLATLRDRLGTVIRGRGQVVGIVGDAGIGKSRLVTEFRRSLDADEVIWVEGACLSYARTVPYTPVLAILRQSCGIAETDSHAVVTGKLRERLAFLGMNVDESAPYLLQLLGLREGAESLAQLTAEEIRRRTIQLYREIVHTASALRPVVMVVEDAHWVDRASEEIFNAVAADNARVLLLCTYRPGLKPPPWMSRSFATQMALSALSPEDSRTMLQSVIEQDVPGPVEEMILSKAEGNPFFLEEIYRSVEGVGRPATLIKVPDSVADVLLARIERLPEGPKSVLQTAAVLGREFAWRLLERVWRGPGSLEAHLAQLTELEFLYQRAGVHGRTYVFTHSLTQQVADESLTPQHRRELHAAAGRALEELFAGRLEEVFDRLAYHYSRTETAGKAVEYLSGMAAKAARSDAREEALLAWRDALLHVERLPPDERDRRRLEVRLALSASLLPLGRIEEMGSLLLPERERLESLKDHALAARYYFLLARMYMIGDHSQVMASAKRAISEAEQCGDAATQGGAYAVLAVACAMSGQATAGIDYGRQAVELLEATPNQWSLSYACWTLGLCYSQRGEFHDALANQDRALEIARAIGDAALQVSAGWAIGLVRAARGESKEGIEACQAAVQAARDPLYRAIATAFLGFAYTQNDEARRAITELEQSIPLVQRFSLRAYDAWFTAFLAEAYRRAGNLEHAEGLAEHARETAIVAGFPVAIGWAELSLGRIAAGRLDFSGAATRLERALKTFKTISSSYEWALVEIDLAGVWHKRGDDESAHRYLRHAHDRLVQLDVPCYRQRVQSLAAEWGLSLNP
jgi:transcriptional regulator with AAA-type ATPase domain/tetratricopeptide (TPR) repeat protein